MTISTLLAGLLALGPAAHAYDITKEHEAGDRLMTVVHAENALPDTDHNAWASVQAAFRLVRRAQVELDAEEAVGAGRAGPAGAQSAQRAALRELADAYNNRVSPALRDIRHAVFVTRKLSQAMHLSLTSIDLNARKGRPSRPKALGEAGADAPGAPRPLAMSELDKDRALALERAAEARTELERALAALGPKGEEPVAGQATAAAKTAEARKALASAVEEALAVARDLGAIDRQEGPFHKALQAGQAFLERSNRALQPDPEAFRAMARPFNAAVTELAGIEFRLARNSGQARYLHGDIDKLGRL